MILLYIVSCLLLVRRKIRSEMENKKRKTEGFLYCYCCFCIFMIYDDNRNNNYNIYYIH